MLIKKIIILLVLITNSVNASVISGNLIKASKFNNSTFTVGDVKTSILSISEFQQLHGSCWIQLNQNVTDINIAGSDLATIKNISTIKSSYGRFLRAEGTNSAALGLTQEDEFKSHTHIQDAHSHNLLMFQDSGGGGNPNNPVHGSATINSQFKTTTSVTAVNQNTGGVETRPKNLTVNMFIKINHECE